MQVKLQGLESFKSLDEAVEQQKLILKGDEIFLDVIQSLIDEAVDIASKEAQGYKNEAIRLAKVLANKEAKEHERQVKKAQREAEKQAKAEQREKEKADRLAKKEAEKEARRLKREEEQEARRIAREQKKEAERLMKEQKEARKEELKEITNNFVDENGQEIIGYKMFPISTEYFNEHIFMNEFVKLSEQAKYKYLKEEENTPQVKEFMRKFKRLNNQKKFIVLKTIDHDDFDIDEIRGLKPNETFEVIETLI